MTSLPHWLGIKSVNLRQVKTRTIKLLTLIFLFLSQPKVQLTLVFPTLLTSIPSVVMPTLSSRIIRNSASFFTVKQAVLLHATLQHRYSEQVFQHWQFACS